MGRKRIKKNAGHKFVKLKRKLNKNELKPYYYDYSLRSVMFILSFSSICTCTRHKIAEVYFYPFFYWDHFNNYDLFKYQIRHLAFIYSKINPSIRQVNNFPKYIIDTRASFILLEGRGGLRFGRGKYFLYYTYFS